MIRLYDPYEPPERAMPTGVEDLLGTTLLIEDPNGEVVSATIENWTEEKEWDDDHGYYAAVDFELFGDFDGRSFTIGEPEIRQAPAPSADYFSYGLRRSPSTRRPQR